MSEDQAAAKGTKADHAVSWKGYQEEGVVPPELNAFSKNISRAQSCLDEGIF